MDHNQGFHECAKTPSPSDWHAVLWVMCGALMLVVILLMSACFGAYRLLKWIAALV